MLLKNRNKLKICYLTDKPSAPGKPEVIATSHTSASLAWQPPKHDGGSRITNYIVESKSSLTYTWSTCSIGQRVSIASCTYQCHIFCHKLRHCIRALSKHVTDYGRRCQIYEPSFTVANLADGSTYEFRVIAENKAGRSEPSAASQSIVVRDVATGNAPRVVEALADVYVTEGKDAVLSCVVKGNPDPDCVW